MSYEIHLQDKARFRHRLKRGERLLGTFLKLLSGQSTEILGALGWDVVIVDQEHAPFDRRTTDEVILAARAAGIAVLVRTIDSAPASIMSALDLGANGVIVPHVRSAAEAQAIVNASRYKGGSRGYANATRAGNWGLHPGSAHVAASDDYVTVIAQIEDVDGLASCADITGVHGLDGIFIGRADLSFALGETSFSAPAVIDAIRRIVFHAQENSLATSTFVTSLQDIQSLDAIGVRSFFYASDMGLLINGAHRARAEFDTLGTVKSDERSL